MKLLLLAVVAAAAAAQDFSQRGFLETSATLYPQTAPNDSSHVVGETLLRYEAFYKVSAHLRLAGGIDARTDTHHETEREFGLSWWDRERQRPAFAVRRLSASYSTGKLNFEVGKQYIRWGKTEVLNPTDRFAPRDFLNLVDNDFLAVTAARLQYGGQANTIDVIFEPRLTPSRVPLLNQRWSAVPAGVQIVEEPPDFPGGPQVGARWNHVGTIAEYSLSFYNGYDNLPLYTAELLDLQTLRVGLRRTYPQMRMYGADAAIPLAWLTVKTEAAYFTSTSPQADEYALYVAQLERQMGEWTLAAGYAGEAVTAHGAGGATYSPTRGEARSFVAHVGYTIDASRSFSFEAVIRQNGGGLYLKPEYTQAFGQHWRVTAGFAVIRGSDTDFLGQYHRNSNALVAVRYSF